MAFKNPNFDEKTLKLINLYEPLSAWFEENVFPITYYGFNEEKYEFEESDYHLHPDLEVLRKMMAICLVWLNSKYEYSDVEKSKKAAAAISKLCDSSNFIDERLKEKFNINISDLDEDFTVDALTPPDLRDLEIAFLMRKKQELLESLAKVDQELAKKTSKK